MQSAKFRYQHEAQDMLQILRAVYPDDDFFASYPYLYEGTYEEGGRVLSMRSVEIAADDLAYT